MQKRRASSLACAVILAVSLLAAGGCGKKGPMLYPDLLVPGASSFILPEQSGDILRLSFDLPVKDRSGRRLKEKSLSGVKIMRLVSVITDGKPCTACPSEFMLYKKIDLEYPQEGVVRSGNRLILTDTDVKEGKRYSYMVIGYLKDGTDGAPSVIVSADVHIPPQPPVLRATSSMGEIHIFADMPDFVSRHGELTGVRLYRTSLVDGADRTEHPLTTVSPILLRYEDRSVQPAARYRYTGRTIIRRPDGIVAESEASKPVEVTVNEAP